NFPAQQNVATAATDYTRFCVTAPSDSRLGANSGKQICGLFDVVPSKFGQVDNLITRVDHFGEATEVFNGIDVGLTARFGNGGYLAGGVSTGRTVRDTCAQNDLPDVTFGVFGAAQNTAGLGGGAGPRISEWCHVTPPWSANTQIKANAIYPLPWQ